MKTQILLSAATLLTVCMGVGTPSGETIYGKECAKCHGKDGKGDTKMGKKLKIEDLTAKAGELSNEQIAKVIKEGLVVDGKKKMKPAKGLSEDDVKALVDYVKSMKQ